MTFIGSLVSERSMKTRRLRARVMATYKNLSYNSLFLESLVVVMKV